MNDLRKYNGRKPYESARHFVSSCSGVARRSSILHAGTSDLAEPQATIRPFLFQIVPQ